MNKDILELDNLELFPKAYLIAEDAHAGQLRDEGIPYITHIDGVVDILMNELGIKTDVELTVAALHDVLEDSDKYTYNDLKEAFGEDVANAVELLTKKKNQKLQDYLRNIAACKTTTWLMEVKLADRVHNLRCLKNNPFKEKIKRKCEETRKYYLDYAKDYEFLYKEIIKALHQLEED